MGNMVGKMKSVANGGGGAGVAASTSNPGSPVQAVGKGKKLGANNRDIGTKAAQDVNFSMHPGHGSAGRTVREVSPSAPYGK